jgi:hypothetical protein
MANKTAVQWLLDNLISEPFSEQHFKHNEECWDKAEEMEKQQIETAFEEGMFHHTNGLCTDEYYNETFKTE